MGGIAFPIRARVLRGMPERDGMIARAPYPRPDHDLALFNQRGQRVADRRA